MELQDFRDPLFKGCTRPAMMFGVPLIPLVSISVVFVLVGVWTNLLILLGLVPIILIMQAITKTDDQQFRLLGLKFLFRGVNYNRNGYFWRASAYSPIEFRKRK